MINEDIVHNHNPVVHSYFRAHFNNDAPEKSEMPFRKSDVFHVVDTLHDGVVGAWQVCCISIFNHFKAGRPRRTLTVTRSDPINPEVLYYYC